MNVAAQWTYALYALSVGICGALALASIPFPRIQPVGRACTAFAASAGLVGLTVRSLASGHLPIFGTFENTYTASWFIVATTAAISYLTPAHRAWRLAPPWAIVLLLYGARFRDEIVPLTISEQSLWVDLHVAFAWVAFTALLVVTTISIARVVGSGIAGYDAGQLELAHQRVFLLGFLNFSVTLVLGSWYLYVLFGTFWRWEIVETVSLIAWLLYAMLLHGRLFYDWSGRWYHAGVVAVLPILLLAYWIWSFFPGTYHFFDIPLVRPY